MTHFTAADRQRLVIDPADAITSDARLVGQTALSLRQAQRLAANRRWSDRLAPARWLGLLLWEFQDRRMGRDLAVDPAFAITMYPAFAVAHPPISDEAPGIGAICEMGGSVMAHLVAPGLQGERGTARTVSPALQRSPHRSRRPTRTYRSSS